jgi:hypothetical protein
MYLHITDGSKGGVGKSIIAQHLVNYLSRHNPIFVYETDTQTDDVAKSVENTARDITIFKADLRDEDGWQSMLETFQELAEDDATSNRHIVMSLPGADINIPNFIDLFAQMCEFLNIELIVWYSVQPIDISHKFVIDSLKDGFGSIPSKKIVVRHSKFGKKEAYAFIDTDKEIKKQCLLGWLQHAPDSVFKNYRNETVTIDEAAENARTSKDGQKPNFLYSSNLTTWAKANTPEFDRIFKQIGIEVGSYE